MVDIRPRALRDGMAAALARNFDLAYQLLQQATTESPADVRGWLWRAVASPSPADAISCLRRVLVFEPSHVQAQDALGRLLAGQATTMAADGQAAQAAALAREASELAPESDAAWMALATVSENPQERLDALRRAHAVNPQAAHVRVQLRDALLHGGITSAGAEPDRARELFREAAGIDPTDPRIWQALARVASSAGDALEALRRLLQLTPDRPGLRAALKRALVSDAESLTASGSTLEAAGRWREALALDENDPAALIGLAETTDEADEARRVLDAIDRAGVVDARVAAVRAKWQPPVEQPVEPALDDYLQIPDLDTLWPPAAPTTSSFEAALDASLLTPAAIDVEPPLAAPVDEPQIVEVPTFTESFTAPLAPEPVLSLDLTSKLDLTPTLDVTPTLAASPAAPPMPASFVIPPVAAPPALDSFVIPPVAAPATPAASFVFPPVTAAPTPEPSFEIPPAAAAPVMNAPAAPIPLVTRPAAARPDVAPPIAISPVVTPPAVAPPVVAPQAVTAPTAAPSIPAAAAPRPAASAPGSKRTVMVVDDSPTVRKILTMTLERAGYGVVAASDGEAALGTLEGSVPDLILLDISMPKLDGYEVCKRIKADARTAHVPVVMLSGKDAFFDKVKGRMAGATEYLTKPFATPAVLAVIGRQLEPETGTVHG